MPQTHKTLSSGWRWSTYLGFTSGYAFPFQVNWPMVQTLVSSRLHASNTNSYGKYLFRLFPLFYAICNILQDGRSVSSSSAKSAYSISTDIYHKLSYLLYWWPSTRNMGAARPRRTLQGRNWTSPYTYPGTDADRSATTRNFNRKLFSGGSSS